MAAAIPSSTTNIVYCNDQAIVALKEYILSAEEQHKEETAETVEAVQLFLSQAQERIQALLAEISDLKKQLVAADNQHEEQQSILIARLSANDQQLALYLSEVKRLTLKIEEIETRKNQQILDLQTRQQQALEQIKEASKLEVAAILVTEQEKANARQADLLARLAELEAKVEEANAKVLLVQAEKEAALQAADAREAEHLRQLQAYENEKKLEPLIRENAAKRAMVARERQWSARDGNTGLPPFAPYINAGLQEWRRGEDLVAEGRALLAADAEKQKKS